MPVSSIDDALLVASLVVAEKITPDVACSLIATIAHDLQHPAVLADFEDIASGPTRTLRSCERHGVIRVACECLLSSLRA